jgi:hypothetical protein
MDRDTRPHTDVDDHGDVDGDGEVERTPTDQQVVWGMLPLFAVIAAILVVVVAFIPASRSHLAFIIPTVIGICVGGYFLARGMRQLR